MMLKQDKDEDAFNVDDDKICDVIKDDEMKF